MKIELNLEDYLTDEEIKNACEKAIYTNTYNKLAALDIDTVIANSSYKIIWKVLDEKFDKNLEEILCKKCEDVINNLSAFSVFRNKDSFNSKKSVGQEILDQKVKESEGLIEKKINEIIESYDFNELKESIGDLVYQCIMDKLSK